MMLSLLMTLLRDPKAANLVAALGFGRPDLVDDLNEICERESKCMAVGMHTGDAKYSNPEWRGQVAIGHLDPTCQPRNVPGGWATRGAHGLSAGTHWYLMWECYDPRMFDIPIVSAWVAMRKYERECEPKRKHRIRGWCKVTRDTWRNNAWLRRG